MARCIRRIHSTAGRHRDLVVKWLFLLRLRRVESISRGRLNVCHGDSLLRTRLVHGDRSRPTLTVDWVLRL